MDYVALSKDDRIERIKEKLAKLEAMHFGLELDMSSPVPGIIQDSSQQERLTYLEVQIPILQEQLHQLEQGQ